MPIAVRVAPGITCGRYPRCSITFTTAAISCSAAPAFITISMARSSYTGFSRATTRQPIFRGGDFIEDELVPCFLEPQCHLGPGATEHRRETFGIIHGNDPVARA